MVREGGRLSAGYGAGAVFLLAPIQSRDAYLLNTEGLILHRWQSDYSLGMSAYLLPDGSTLRGAREQPPRNFRQPGGSGGRVQRIAWDGTVLWDVLYAGDRFFSRHDIHPMPNGTVLLTAWEHQRPDEALAGGRAPRQARPNDAPVGVGTFERMLRQWRDRSMESIIGVTVCVVIKADEGIASDPRIPGSVSYYTWNNMGESEEGALRQQETADGIQPSFQ